MFRSEFVHIHVYIFTYENSFDIKTNLMFIILLIKDLKLKLKDLKLRI